VISSAGGEPRRLTSGADLEEYREHPIWSPDGQWIIFKSDREGRPLWRVPAEGGEAESFVDGWSPKWSTDAKQMYFAARREGRANLFGRETGAKAERQLTDFVGKPGFLDSLADTDGEFLYFTWREDHGDLWVMDVEQQGAASR
jgi:Tol biopolymer transport system component